MSVVLYALGVVAFAVLILSSIGLHEFGHLIPAKRFGAKVSQWMIGFGNTVWSFTPRGSETEYGLKAIPLGGFVRIKGMLIQDELTADEEPRAFYRLVWWKKVIIMAGGPIVNLLIAFVLFSLVFGLYGQRDLEARPGQPVVAEVSQCVIPFAQEGRACTSSDPVSPAYEAGLRPGDVITSFNGTAVKDWNQLRLLIQNNASGTAVIGYTRNGVAMSGTTNTTVAARPTSDSDLSLHQVGFLGVSPASVMVTHKHGPGWTIEQMGDMTKQSVVSLGKLPKQVWNVALAIVHVKPRAADSPVSIVGGGRIAGEVASDKGFDLGEKLTFLLSLVAGFNLFIGLFNFVPLLPLDGGHIIAALWEGVRRGFSRVFRRPKPGHIDASALLPIAYVVAAFLVVMGAVLIVGDLVVPVPLS